MKIKTCKEFKPMKQALEYDIFFVNFQIYDLFEHTNNYINITYKISDYVIY